jgi:hypothetical protein
MNSGEDFPGGEIGKSNWQWVYFGRKVYVG